MLGVLSTQAIPASKYLKDAECSLYRLAVLGQQGDGWGIGYYIDGKLDVFKSEKPVYEESDLFENVVGETRSRSLIAHVRKASNPRNLPRESLISKVNSQPFYHSSFLFVHNGTLFIPDQVLSELQGYRDLVLGINDSEVLFAYLLLNLRRSGNIEEAVNLVEKGLWEIHKKSGYSGEYPYSSLNFIFSDGKQLYAYERYLVNPRITSYCNGTPYFEMYYHANEDEIIVASEKLTLDDWEPIPNGGLLSAQITNDKITFAVKKLH